MPLRLRFLQMPRAWFWLLSGSTSSHHRAPMLDRRDIASWRKARERDFPHFFIPAHSLPTDASIRRFSPDMTLMEMICSFRQSFFQITKPITRYAQHQPSHFGIRRIGFCHVSFRVSGAGIVRERQTGIGNPGFRSANFRDVDIRLRRRATSDATSESGVIANNRRRVAEQKPGGHVCPAIP